MTPSIKRKCTLIKNTFKLRVFNKKFTTPCINRKCTLIKKMYLIMSKTMAPRINRKSKMYLIKV